MLNKFFVLVIFMGLSSLAAQTFMPKILNSNYNNYLQSNSSSTDVNILAVMVDFQPDNFELTYGDGTFGSIYSQEYGNNIIDPLPHNQEYFEDHLQFAKNYFNKVSNDKVNIDFTVLPNVLTVSQPMREYSPVGEESFKPLADFSKEVWEMVSASYPNYDFSSFNTFLIFHAGAGKDISTSDLFGEARDLPSIYLGKKSFQNIYGETFNGFQLNDGSIVDNTMILPETESREESSFGGVSLIELSINGLIVSSIASHIGLPDLFDSETGKSAIGRFGLMDGQSLFAFAGLFPPEPSAWEKIFLGWEEPKIVLADTDNILVTVSEIANENDNQIIKVPINSTEYYLIENRNRDALNDGVTLTYKVGGQVRTISFTEDLDNFNNAFVDTMKGVVIDVDEHDWAVPGNGLLIWHIDEKIIDQNYEVNRINVGDNRGVDLEEADGIQDIGEEFQTIFGETVIAEGEEFDLWHSENPSKLYENIFGPDSKPNTKTNSGANSLVSLSNFSAIGNQMSFDVSFGSEYISPIFNQTKSGLLTDIKIIEETQFIEGYAILSGDLVGLASRPQFRITDFSESKFITFEKENVQFFFGINENTLNIVYNDSDTILQSVTFDGVNTAPIVLKQNSDNDINILIGLANGQVLNYKYNLQTKELPVLEETLTFFADSIDQIVTLDNEVVASSGSKLKFLNGTEVDLSYRIEQIVLTKNSSDKYLAIALTENNMISSVEKDLTVGKKVQVNDSDISSIALADIKNDGDNYIVYNYANKINAINLEGSFAENFPYELTNNDTFAGSPLVADLDGDNYSDIVSTTSNGDIYAVSGKDGKVISGFPISIGNTFSGNQTIVKREADLLLSSVTSDNQFYFWSINSLGGVNWGSEYGNNMNTSSLNSANNTNYISTYFPKDKTYNWPNPVYDNETFIRTYVSEDSQVKVKVFDLAGDLVDEFEFSANGGYDTEHVWNVTEIQSGAYFAHVEVKSSSGKSESKIIKIAVVK